MPLQSKLFAGDPKLEACLVSDPAHVMPGSRGDHVAKIQKALNQIDDAGLKVDGIYGPLTAQAVQNFKNDPSRRILGPGQATADTIVGKGTIAALDREMAALENKPAGQMRITVLTPLARPARSAPAAQRASLGFAVRAPLALLDAGAPATAVVIDPTQPGQSMRLAPRDVAKLLIRNPGGDCTVTCVNHPPKKGDVTNKVCWVSVPDVDTDRLSPEPKGQADQPPEEFGNRIFLFRKEDAPLNLDGFRPGDATLVAVNGAGQQSSLLVIVRAKSAGPVARAPLTVLEPGSKFFSASQANGGEFDPLGIFMAGRSIRTAAAD